MRLLGVRGANSPGGGGRPTPRLHRAVDDRAVRRRFDSSIGEQYADGFAMISEANATSGRRVPLLAAAACAVVTAGMSLAAFHADAARSDARDSEARAQAAGALEVLTAGLQSRVVDVRSLFVSSRSVSEREFSVFTAADGRARARERAQLAGRSRRAGAPRSSARSARPITTLSPTGELVRDTTPGTLFPIRYAARRRQRPLGGRLQRLHPAPTAAPRSSARSPPAARPRRRCCTSPAPTSRASSSTRPSTCPAGAT